MKLSYFQMLAELKRLREKERAIRRHEAHHAFLRYRVQDAIASLQARMTRGVQ